MAESNPTQMITGIVNQMLSEPDGRISGVEITSPATGNIRRLYFSKFKEFPVLPLPGQTCAFEVQPYGNSFYIQSFSVQQAGAAPATQQQRQQPPQSGPQSQPPQPASRPAPDPARDRLIVRQTALKAAVKYGETSELSDDEIMRVADRFFAWVMELPISQPPAPPAGEPLSDYPYVPGADPEELAF